MAPISAGGCSTRCRAPVRLPKPSSPTVAAIHTGRSRSCGSSLSMTESAATATVLSPTPIPWSLPARCSVPWGTSRPKTVSRCAATKMAGPRPVRSRATTLPTGSMCGSKPSRRHQPVTTSARSASSSGGAGTRANSTVRSRTTEAGSLVIRARPPCRSGPVRRYGRVSFPRTEAPLSCVGRGEVRAGGSAADHGRHGAGCR